jgi:hypothetical protein
MSEKAATMVYDAAKKRAVLTFPNGRELAIADVTEEQANTFLERHASEFARRDCCLTSVDGQFTRSGEHGE